MYRIGVLLAALILALVSAPPAGAIEPPTIDAAAVPPDETGPDQPMEQRRVCAAPSSFPNSNFADRPWANDYLRLSDAQKFATGAGITVAVIDTGVTGSARVPAEPGGDFVDEGANGMSDCDAHGTLTASIIAGRPAPTDAFIGVAPDARILSLRQTSDAFQPVGARTDPNNPNTTQTAGSLRSLARAIVHAANVGAQVINISEAACYKITRPIDESGVGAAINYAVNVKGAVVIAAAGNTGQNCNQNPPPDPADARRSARLEAGADDRLPGVVLAAGADGRRYRAERSAEHLLDVRARGWAPRRRRRTSSRWAMTAIRSTPCRARTARFRSAGTSFAAAYVSGLAALLKQRFPDLTPAQIINRITATARHPGGGVDNYVGAGVIDPVAALTWDVPAGPETVPYKVKQLPPPVYVPPPDRGPITAVVVTGAGLALALGLGALARRALRRR